MRHPTARTLRAATAVAASLLALSRPAAVHAQGPTVPPRWTLDSIVDPMTDGKVMKAGLFSSDGAPMQLTLSCTGNGLVMLFFEGLEPIDPGPPYGPIYLTSARYRLGRAPAVRISAIFAPGASKTLGLASGDPRVSSEQPVVRGMAAGPVTLWLEYPTLQGTRRSRFDVPAGSAPILRHVYRTCGKRSPV